MEKEFKILKDWTISYIKNRDLLTKAIKKIEENKGGWDIAVKTRTEKRHYMIMPRIKNIRDLLEKLNDSMATVVVLNTKENLDAVIENWSALKEHKKLCIIFVNPDSELEKKWIVFPYTHERITEKASLKKGLKSLFHTVEPWKK